MSTFPITSSVHDVVVADLAACWVAPVRFDTHVVSALRSWLDDTSSCNVEIDLRAAQFIDMAAIEALRSEHTARAARGLTLTVIELSLASRLTLDMVRAHELLGSAACAVLAA